MQNIIDYIKWRGDLNFSNDHLNEVDNLIFSVLSYLEFDGIVPCLSEAGSISLGEAADMFIKSAHQSSPTKHKAFINKIKKLLLDAGHSKRYQGVRISSYVNYFDFKTANQFAAVVFSISDDLHYVAFRGTDDSLVGWKEDFQMSFIEEVPAQQQAVTYLQQAAAKYAGNFYLGGHSKGGNLAVYAAAKADECLQGRIINIQNNDGPGFMPNFMQSEGYQNIRGKINTLMPQSSIIGMMLEQNDEYKVVSSYETGLMQHFPFSWEVQGNHFVYEKRLAKVSLTLNKVVRGWLNKVSPEQRAESFGALFQIIQSTGAATISELSSRKLAASLAMIKTYKNLDPQTRSNFKNAVKIFIAENRKILRKSIRKDFGSLFWRDNWGRS